MFVNVTTKSAQHAHARMIAKTDLIHRQEMRPLHHGGCLHDVRDASLVCESSQFYIYIYIYIYIVGFDHGLPCRVKNTARGTQ